MAGPGRNGSHGGVAAVGPLCRTWWRSRGRPASAALCVPSDGAPARVASRAWARRATAVRGSEPTRSAGRTSRTSCGRDYPMTVAMQTPAIWSKDCTTSCSGGSATACRGRGRRSAALDRPATSMIVWARDTSCDTKSCRSGCFLRLADARHVAVVAGTGSVRCRRLVLYPSAHRMARPMPVRKTGPVGCPSGLTTGSSSSGDRQWERGDRDDAQA